MASIPGLTHWITAALNSTPSLETFICSEYGPKREKKKKEEKKNKIKK